MSRKIQLREMTEKEFEAYMRYHIEHHAESLVKDKGISKEEAARQFACKQCALFVADANTNARRLYEKCGYIYRNERENGRYMDKDV